MSAKKLEESQYFYTCDGNQLKSLKEFFDVLPEMQDSVFSHHVNGERNDFANWIINIFQNSDLGNKIQSSQTKKEMISSIIKYLEGKKQKNESISISPKAIRPLTITKEFALSKMKESYKKNG